MNKKELGMLGEEMAAEYLKGEGYIIMEKNFRSGPGEIDIIASVNDWIMFIEVKTRTGSIFGSPEESIDFTKAGRIRKTAAAFLMNYKPLRNKSIRFDVISVKINKKRLEKVIISDSCNDALAGQYEMFGRIEHITDAF
jgi:putative endonuclease